jgi:hypothetical protein
MAIVQGSPLGESSKRIDAVVGLRGFGLLIEIRLDSVFRVRHLRSR